MIRTKSGNHRMCYREDSIGAAKDKSCPAFAYDDRFQSLVLAHGGLPTAMIMHGVAVWLGPDGRLWKERLA